jgi:DNA-binding XRE family transcriptional regulator
MNDFERMRTELKWSRAVAAKTLDVSPATIWRWEKLGATRIATYALAAHILMRKLRIGDAAE